MWGDNHDYVAELFIIELHIASNTNFQMQQNQKHASQQMYACCVRIYESCCKEDPANST